MRVFLEVLVDIEWFVDKGFAFYRLGRIAGGAVKYANVEEI